MATRNPGLHEAPVEVQGKDKEKHENIILLLDNSSKIK